MEEPRSVFRHADEQLRTGSTEFHAGMSLRPDMFLRAFQQGSARALSAHFRKHAQQPNGVSVDERKAAVAFKDFSVFQPGKPGELPLVKLHFRKAPQEYFVVRHRPSRKRVDKRSTLLVYSIFLRYIPV